jgi:hypothetical protein
MHPHLAGNMCQNHVPVFELDSEGSVGEVLQNLSLHLDHIVLGHHKTQLPIEVLKLAFFNSDSYCCDIM